MSLYFHASPQSLHHLKQVQTLLDQLQPQASAQAVITPGSPIPQGDIIVFPGSFNPPTTAHLAMLAQARQFAQQQEASAQDSMLVYVAMSKQIVDKERVERPLLLDRIALLETLLKQRLPETGIMLFNRGLYVEQAEGVRTSFPTVKKLYFVLGFDKIVQILDPRYYKDRASSLKQLFGLAQLLVAPRGKDGPDALQELLEQPRNQQFAHHIHALPLNTTYRDISSSRIRQHGDENEYSHDVPPEVHQFMQETHAYAPPTQLQDGTTIDFYEQRVKALQAALHDVSV